jgi:cytoskeleton protein RodZ
LLHSQCYHSAVSSFGEHLRREREMRGVSLDEIVKSTKISRRLLQALEDEQFDLLPGGIFNRSYVRAYAKCVGIDEDQAVAEYLDASKEVPPDTRVIAHQHASIHSDRPTERSGFPLMPVLVLLVIAAGAVGGWKMYQDRQRDRVRTLPQPAVESSTTPAASAPATEMANPESNPPASEKATEAAPLPSKAASASTDGTSGETRAAAPARPEASNTAEAAGSPFEIIVRPKDRAWVSIKADGNYVVRGVIQPPEVRTIHATGQIVFYTGNAGAVDVVFDGKNVPLTGGPNAEQTLVFDSHGLLPQAAAP